MGAGNGNPEFAQADAGKLPGGNLLWTWGDQGGLRTPGCQSPLMLPGISTEGVRSVGGDNYKGNGRVDLAERENSRRSEWTRECSLERSSSPNNDSQRSIILKVKLSPWWGSVGCRQNYMQSPFISPPQLVKLRRHPFVEYKVLAAPNHLSEFAKLIWISVFSMESIQAGHPSLENPTMCRKSATSRYHKQLTMLEMSPRKWTEK